MKKLLFLILLLTSSATLSLGDSTMSRGVSAFGERKWSEAMDAFLEVLRQDPSNTEAHAYVTLTAREMEAERRAVIREHRLEMLGDASKRVEANRQDATPLTEAIIDTSQSEKRAQEE